MSYSQTFDSYNQDSLAQWLKNGAPRPFILVDVRRQPELIKVIGTTECIPYNLAWPDSVIKYSSRLPADIPVLLYCRSGNRSGQALGYLRDSLHLSNISNAGGIMTWTGPTLQGSSVLPVTALPQPSMKKAISPDP